MDIADWNGVPFRRLLRSADRFSEAATLRGLLKVNTLGSRSRALLVAVTRCDHREAVRRAGVPFRGIYRNMHVPGRLTGFPVSLVT